MNDSDDRFNPFPGLRPYNTDEDYLFFGREGQSDELLRRMRDSSFVAVVGASGSGKSSLVRAGLLPALQGGFMTQAGASWRVASMRPGNDPIGELARTLDKAELFGAQDGPEAATLIQSTTMTETILRRSALGVVHVVQEARLPKDQNLLILVDQFEELFRFREAVTSPEQLDDAAAFVKLLINASRAKDLPIYIILTMRSDFLGDCAQFRDLPEEINKGQYLIPRMVRDQYRRTIEGPVAVGGAKITKRLVQRLLSDLGDSPDQLPILQHALMRTWDIWQNRHKFSEPLDLPDYETIGGMDEGLSQHADEVYDSLPDDRRREIAKEIFKRLTGKGPDNRGIRWPTQLLELAAVAEATEAEVIEVVEAFRQPGRSFLVPPAGVDLESSTVLDISHESLMRVWVRLKTWVEKESESADMYRRLAERAVLHKEDRAGLWRDPELQLALVWWDKQQPNEAWAQRYNPKLATTHRYQPDLAAAKAFLNKSRNERDKELAKAEADRKREIRRLRTWLIALIALLVLAGVAALYAIRQQNEAERSQAAAIVAEEEAVTARDEAVAAKDDADLARDEAVLAKEDAETARNQSVLAEEKARARLHLAQAEDVFEVNPLLGIRLALEGLALLPDKDILETAQELIDSGRIANIYSDTERLDPHPNNDALYVVGREEGLSEIWHANHNAPLARLTEPLENVIFNPDGTLFLVDYTNAPSELRQTADGRVIATLSGGIHRHRVQTYQGRIFIESAFFSPDSTSSAFVVNYRDLPAEMWDSESGELLATLTDDVFDVNFSPNGNLMEVEYIDLNIPGELRLTADGSIVATGIGNVEYSPEEKILLIDFADENVADELRLADDGSVIATLEGDVVDVTYNHDETLVIVEYPADTVSDELRNIENNRVITTLTDDVIIAKFSPGGTLFVLDYQNSDVDDELRNAEDGAPIMTFPDEVSNFIFSPDESLLIVDYSDSGKSDEIIQTSDQRVIASLSGDVRNVTFNDDESIFFIENFLSTGELRRASDGSTLATGIEDIFVSPEETIYFVDYEDPEIPDELRSASDGSLVESLSGNVDEVMFSPDESLYFVRYADGSGELIRAEGAVRVATGVAHVNYGPNGALYLLNYRDPDVPDELRRSADDSILASGVSQVSFSPEETYFVVAYEEPELRVELRRTADGELVAETDDPDISSVTFSPDETSLVVQFADEAAEVIQTTNGEPLATLTGEVDNVAFNALGRQSMVHSFPGQVNYIVPFMGQIGDQVTIHVESDQKPNVRDVYVELLNTNGNSFMSASGDGEAEIDNLLLTESGRYAIEIFGDSSDDYTLSVNVDREVSSDEMEEAETAGSPFFVAYYDNGRAEIWDIADKELITTVEGVANVSFGPDPESNIIVVEYDSGAYEVRNPANGNVITLSGPTSDISFSPDDDGFAFIVRYSDGTAELRDRTNGELITRLTSSTSDQDAVVLSRPGALSFFGLRYSDSATEIYGSIDGEKLADLAGDAYDLLCANLESIDTCVIAYTENDLPGEVRRASDGQRLATLKPKVLKIRFGPEDSETIFIVDYAEAPSEVRHSDDGRLVAKLPDIASKITFSPDPESSIFIIDFSSAPSEIRNSEDGKLLAVLPDQVQDISFSDDPDSRVFVVSYDMFPGELRRTSDGQLLATLSDMVVDTTFSNDLEARVFFVTYAGGLTELRRTEDGEELVTLSGEVLETLFSRDEESTFFSITYADMPTEVRQSADGQVLAVLDGESVGWLPPPTPADTLVDSEGLPEPMQFPDATVEFNRSAETPFFQVYYDQGQVEVRRIDDGSIVTWFDTSEDEDELVADVSFSAESTAAGFVVQYLSGRHEFWRISEGQAEALPISLPEIRFSRGDNPAIAAVYMEEAPWQIWRLANVSPLVTATITNPIQLLYVSPDEPASLFFVDYVDAPGEIYWMADGALLDTLPDEIGAIQFYNDMLSSFVVEYQDSERMAELRHISDGELRITLSQPQINRITFSTDEELFIVYYRDDTADVYLTATFEPLEKFTEEIRDVLFDFEGLVSFDGDIAGSIRGPSGETWPMDGLAGDTVTIAMDMSDLNLSTGNLAYLELFDSNGDLLGSDAGDSQNKFLLIGNYRLPYSGEYAVTARSECCGGDYSLSIQTRSRTDPEEDEVQKERNATVMVAHFSSGRAEMWSLNSGEKLATLQDVERVSFSPDPDNALALVENTSGLIEVRRSSDGEQLAEKVTRIIFSPDRDAEYFIVTYEDAPAEIFRTSSGEKLAQLDREVVNLTFSNEEEGIFYFVVEYEGDLSHVWVAREGSLEYVTDLGSNVDQYFLDVLNQRLAVRHEDGHIYLIDLAMPEALKDVSLANDMLQEACDYLFPPGTFDEGELEEYLGDNYPVACQ